MRIANLNLQKFFWVLRALLYRPFFKSFGIPSYLGEPLYIDGLRNISVGKMVRIFPGLRLEAIDDGKVEIGNNVVIEQNVHIISKGSTLYIGDDVTIAPNVFITNVNHGYEDINRSVMDQPLICKKTEIGSGCFIGFGATVQAGTTLGKHCVVASNAVAQGCFEDYAVIAGVPGKVIKKYDVEAKSWK